MNKIQKSLILAITGILCIYIPTILLLHIIYVVIFKIDIVFISYTTIALGLASGISIAGSYSQKNKRARC